MKTHIYQRLGVTVLQITAVVVLLLIARSYFPAVVYTVAPIALAAILAFLIVPSVLRKLRRGRNT